MRAPLYSENPGEILSESAISDPQRLYTRLRCDTPLARIYDSGVHTVATWSIIEEVLAREEDFSANLTGVLYKGADGNPACFDLPSTDATTVIATADDPEHAVHRAILQPRFLAAKIKSMEPVLKTWAAEALAPLIEAGRGDFVPAAENVPARAVAQLLGLPESDLALHRRWAMMGGDMLAGEVSDDGLTFLATETAKMADYLGMHLDRSMAEPSPEDITDDSAAVMDILARSVIKGDIRREQALGIAIVLFGAGGESTAALIGSALHALASMPDVAAQLLAKPELTPLFIEEVIRLEPPFKFHYRAVRRSCELDGYELHPGDRLMLLWASANRDPARFDDPDTLRLDRKQTRQHLGFGRGSHFCIGAGLARLEARVMIEALLEDGVVPQCIPNTPPRYARSIFVRRFESLPLAIKRS